MPCVPWSSLWLRLSVVEPAVGASGDPGPNVVLSDAEGIESLAGNGLSVGCCALKSSFATKEQRNENVNFRSRKIFFFNA